MTYAELTAAIQDYTENTFTATELATFVDQAEQRIYNSVQLANLRKNVTGVLTSGNKYLSAPEDYLSTYSLAIYSYATPIATGTSGAFTVTVSSATNIEVNQRVYGTGIGTGAIVALIVGTTITLSVANSGTVSGELTFQGDYLYLLSKDVNFIREVYPSPLVTAKPKYYAIFGPVYNNVNELTFIVGPTPDIGYKAELHYYYYPTSIVTAGTTWLGDNFSSSLLYGSLVEAYTFMKGEPDMMALYDNKYKESLALLQNLGQGKQRGDSYRDGQIKIPVR
jgi:hypothetical protein